MVILLQLFAQSQLSFLLQIIFDKKRLFNICNQNKRCLNQNVDFVTLRLRRLPFEQFMQMKQRYNSGRMSNKLQFQYGVEQVCSSIQTCPGFQFTTRHPNLLINEQDIFWELQQLSMLSKAQLVRKFAPKININSLELFKINNFSFRRLSWENKEAALYLMAKQFSNREPISQAIYKVQPHIKVKAYQNQHKLWSIYIDQCIESGLSVVIFDLQKNQELIGVTILKDYYLQKPDYEREILVDDNVMLPTEMVAKKMINSIEPDKSYVFQKEGNVVDLWGGAIKEGYTGRGLFKHMITSSCHLAKQAGYQHAFAFSTNFKTAISFKNLGFSRLAEINIKDLKINGKKIFKQIEQLHSSPSVWLKCLD